MNNFLLLFGTVHLQLQTVQVAAEALQLTVTSIQPTADCPICGQASERIHSQYGRRVADLPCAGRAVSWRVQARRFFCDNPACAKTTFAERLADVAVWARRTNRLKQTQSDIGLALGGEAGARLTQHLGMATSPDTLLRLIRARAPIPVSNLRIVGVDDWAWRRGHTYGPLLVDLERSQPVDLLPDRTADALAEWLVAHPGIEVISRDRAGAYADGATRGAPNAVQVADRWHLLGNLAEALEDVFERQPASLRAISNPETPVLAAPEVAKPPEKPAEIDVYPAPPPTRQEQRRHANRTKRLERFETVRGLHQQGVSQRAIAWQLKMSPGTIRRFLNAPVFPERAQRKKVPSRLDPFLPYVRERWNAGCHNGLQLWREIVTQGYTGARALLSRWVAAQRCTLPTRPARAPRGQWPRPLRPPLVPRPQLISAQRAASLLLTKPADLSEAQAALITRWSTASPEMAMTCQLAQSFAKMLRERQRDQLDAWLQAAHTSPVRELKAFAHSLQRDYAAVAAALSLNWSNGPTEGHINRLKLVKRQMYGRANFDLLRQRVLHRV